MICAWCGYPLGEVSYPHVAVGRGGVQTVNLHCQTCDDVMQERG